MGAFFSSITPNIIFAVEICLPPSTDLLCAGRDTGRFARQCPRGEAGGGSEGGETGGARLGPRALGEPRDKAVDIDRGGDRDVLYVGLLSAPLPGLAQAQGPHPLRERPCAPGATLIALPPLLTGLPGPGRLECFPVLLRRQREAAPGLRGPEAQRPGGTGSTVLETEAAKGRRLALALARLPPPRRDRALGTVRLLLLPSYGER